MIIKLQLEILKNLFSLSFSPSLFLSRWGGLRGVSQRPVRASSMVVIGSSYCE